jgi:hypothetical protein
VDFDVPREEGREKQGRQEKGGMPVIVWLSSQKADMLRALNPLGMNRADGLRTTAANSRCGPFCTNHFAGKGCSRKEGFFRKFLRDD